MSDRIERREARLLRWEPYLRRTRHVALGLAGIGVCVSLAKGWLGVTPALDDGSAFWVCLLLLAVAYQAHLKIRHIESIRFHRGRHGVKTTFR